MPYGSKYAGLPWKQVRYCPNCKTTRIFVKKRFPTRFECKVCGYEINPRR